MAPPWSPAADKPLSARFSLGVLCALCGSWDAPIGGGRLSIADRFRRRQHGPDFQLVADVAHAGRQADHRLGEPAVAVVADFARQDHGWADDTHLDVVA